MADIEKRVALVDEDLTNVSGGNDPENVLEAKGLNLVEELEKPGTRDQNVQQ